jgi:hypothetical protein
MRLTNEDMLEISIAVVLGFWCSLFHRRYHWPAAQGGMCGHVLMECRKCGCRWIKPPW